jgi:hypothetical protein
MATGDAILAGADTKINPSEDPKKTPGAVSKDISAKEEEAKQLEQLIKQLIDNGASPGKIQAFRQLLNGIRDQIKTGREPTGSERLMENLIIPAMGGWENTNYDDVPFAMQKRAAGNESIGGAARKNLYNENSVNNRNTFGLPLMQGANALAGVLSANGGLGGALAGGAIKMGSPVFLSWMNHLLSEKQANSQYEEGERNSKYQDSIGNRLGRY